MAVMTLILADSGYGKTYSIRNVNPESAILARCIRKALPFRNTGWKLHGKRLPDNTVQRGNVVDIRNGRHLLDVIRNAAMSNRKILIIDDFQAVMQHENMDRALRDWLHQVYRNGGTRLANHRSCNPATGRLPRLFPRSHRRERRENQDEDRRQDA
ncbi:hypothetical protein ABFY58_02045 [Enterobacter soli]